MNSEGEEDIDLDQNLEDGIKSDEGIEEGAQSKGQKKRSKKKGKAGPKEEVNNNKTLITRSDAKEQAQKEEDSKKQE